MSLCLLLLGFSSSAHCCGTRTPDIGGPPNGHPKILGRQWHPQNAGATLFDQDVARTVINSDMMNFSPD
jgi:hypothetical protein